MRHWTGPLDTTSRYPRRDWLRMLGLACLGAAGTAPRWAVARQGKPGRIFVTGNIDNQNGLVAYDPENGGWATVLSRCGTRPRVSPDGKSIAFEREDAIWIAATDGGGEERKILDLGRPTNGSPPIWSGDGKRLILSPAVRDEARDHWRFETFRFGADGANKEALAIPDTDGVHDWSPDGAWVINVSSRNATLGWTLYLMRPDGTEERRMTEGGNPFNARFSPDGTKLLYDDGGSDEKRGPWIIVVDGRARQRVFAVAKGQTSSSCWSPDGKRIAVVTYDVARSGQGAVQGRLEVMDVDGRNHASYPLADETTAHADMPDWR